MLYFSSESLVLFCICAKFGLVTLREEQRMFKGRVLRKIFGPKRESNRMLTRYY
jgi:hypothetical protein